MKKAFTKQILMTTMLGSIIVLSACAGNDTDNITSQSFTPMDVTTPPSEETSSPQGTSTRYTRTRTSDDYAPSVTPTPTINRSIQGDSVVDVIQPMSHWTDKRVETKDGKVGIIFTDNDPEASIENFDNYIDNIAGFDVFPAAYNSNINVHSCRVPEDLSGIDNCFAQFRTRIGDQWYDFLINMGYYDEGQTPRPVEIYAYPRSSYSYDATADADWEF